ncbi:MAG: hypothetical protein SGILL_000802 [Bacillariaceae sp.]
MGIDSAESAHSVIADRALASSTSNNKTAEKEFNVRLNHDLVKGLRDDTTYVFVNVPSFESTTKKSVGESYFLENLAQFDRAIVVVDPFQDDEVAFEAVLRSMKMLLKKKPSACVAVICDVGGGRGMTKEIVDRMRRLEEEVHSVNKFALRERFPTKHLTPKPAPSVHINMLSYDSDDDEDIVVKNSGSETAVDLDMPAAIDLIEASLTGDFEEAIIPKVQELAGDIETQTKLLEEQKSALLARLVAFESFARDLFSICERFMHMEADSGRWVSRCVEKFWKLYGECEHHAFTKFETEMDPSRLALPMDQLLEFKHWIIQLEIELETEKLETASLNLVKRQLQMVLHKVSLWSFDDWYNTMNTNQWKITVCKDWGHVSPSDWNTIISSLLLASSDCFFYESFGQEKIMLERARFLSGDRLVKADASTDAELPGLASDGCKAKRAATAIISISMLEIDAMVTPSDITTRSRVPSFQIRTAVVGVRGSGKTALLNALFQRKVSHCSDEYGTKSINRFHVVSSIKKYGLDDAQVFEATKEVNEDVFGTEHGVPVKEFHISLNNSDIETTENVELVFEDIPGCLRGREFSDYMKSVWGDIDCLIFVADLQRSSYTSDDENLFNMVDVLMKQKEVPLLIVGNKFDDVKDEATTKRAAQVKQIVDMMAEKQKSKDAPSEYHCGEEKKEDASVASLPTFHQASVRPPAFVSLSSRRALWYRYASILSQEALEKESDLVDEILIDHFGELKALGMSKEQKLRSVWTLLHGHVEDSVAEELRVSSGQFDQLCHWIRGTMCEASPQQVILQRQQELCLKKLESDDLNVVDRLRQIHLTPWSIQGGDPDSLVATFWALWHACEDNALADFSRTVDVRVFETPLKHLCAYKKLLQETKWENMIVVISALQSLLRSQIKIIIKQHQQWSFEHWYMRRDHAKWVRRDSERRSWKCLSPVDWANIYSSMLLVVNDRYICTRMGKEKIMLKNLLQRSNEGIFSAHQHIQRDPDSFQQSQQAKSLLSRKLFSGKRIPSNVTVQALEIPFHTSDGCPSLERCMDGYFSLTSGILIPTYPKTYASVVTMEAPSSLDDPSHFGHVAFVYRNVLASIGKKKI